MSETLTSPTQITDEQTLISAKRGNWAIPVYDDGYGPLWIHRHSIGISGIVRARTWEDAYSICEDEFFPEADETVDELRAEYNKVREHVKYVRLIGHKESRPATFADYPLDEHGLEFDRWETVETPADDENAWVDNELFQEAFGFRPNGANVRDKHKHGIYARDLSCDRLDRLTDELAEAEGITLVIETPTAE